MGLFYRRFFIIKKKIESLEYTVYDELIQLCDALALPSGFTFVERRIIDIGLRYGLNDMIVKRWKSLLMLQHNIEKKLGYSIYKLLPGINGNFEHKICDAFSVISDGG